MLILLLISEFYIKVDKIWLKKNKYSKKSNYSKFSHNPCKHFMLNRLFAQEVSPKTHLLISNWWMPDFW